MTEDPHAPTTAGPVPTTGATSASDGSGSEGGVQAKATEVAGQAQAKATEVAGQAQAKATEVAGQAQQLTGERPEILVGAAFAGGFLAAMILKRLGR